MLSIAINGFGRIGRTLLRTILMDSTTNIKVSAINIGQTNPEFVAHMFKYDTIMGTYPKEVSINNNILTVDNYKIKIITETDPAKINWKNLEVELVVDCTGQFTDGKDAIQHINSGAKYVLISAPAQNEDITIIQGVNDHLFDKHKHKIISIGSCTSNAFLPTLKVLHDEFKIISGIMTTTHAYTNTQPLLDVERDDLRKARAAALNIIPTSTGAGKLIGKIIPELKDVIGTCAIRVPVGIVSLIDFSFTCDKPISVDLINSAFKKSSAGNLKNILAITMQPLVSSDFKENSNSVIIDGLLTQLAGNMAKVFGWYDNEWGYSCRLRDFVKTII